MNNVSTPFAIFCRVSQLSTAAVNRYRPLPLVAIVKVVFAVANPQCTDYCTDFSPFVENGNSSVTFPRASLGGSAGRDALEYCLCV
jgi:hypothetical protein